MAHTHDALLQSLFFIFTGAWVLSTLSLYARQSMLVAYLFLGMLLGPHALARVQHPDLLHQFSEVGIMFLLFLVGLELKPNKVVNLVRRAFWITLFSSLLFGVMGALVAFFSGLSLYACALVAVSMMFSSTIISLKLMPTTALHHQRMGELMISILLIQDLFAVLGLTAIQGSHQDREWWSMLVPLLVSLPGLALFALLFERWLLVRLIRRFDRIKEYLFLLAIAWCLGLAEIAEHLHLSREIGAFIAGITLAECPIAWFMAENLKPLRDFFLIVFFFTVGATLNLHVVMQCWVPILILASLMLFLKPLIFRILLRLQNEPDALASEAGWRLGQCSEFALLIATVASTQVGALSPDMRQTLSAMIQGSTVLTFMLSTYWVVLRYPTPASVSDRLRRD